MKECRHAIYIIAKYAFRIRVLVDFSLGLGTFITLELFMRKFCVAVGRDDVLMLPEFIP